MTKRRLFVPCVLLCLSPWSSVSGMGLDGGAMLNLTEQGMVQHQGSRGTEGFPIEYYPGTRWTDHFSIQVDAVMVEGNSLVADDLLQAAVKPHIGKSISVHRLSVLTRLIEKAYRDRGHKAQAYVPEQSFARNKLVIQVIER